MSITTASGAVYIDGTGGSSSSSSIYYNVTASPYLADNTGVNDSRTGIQAAIDAAYAAGGGTVYVPAGLYKVTKASSSASGGCLILKDDVILRGDGMGVSIILFAAQTAQKVTGIIRTTSGVVTRKASVIDITVDGNRSDIGRLIKSIVVSGTTATATVPAHTQVTGDSITISGASVAAYNSTFTVTVVDRNTFTFAITGGTASPAYGTLLYTVTGQGFAISSLTAASTTATAVSTAHGLTSGTEVLIAGAADNKYNAVTTITVSDADTFTFTIPSGATSPDTGTPKWSYVHDGYFCGVNPSLFITGGIANVSGNTYRMTVASGHGIVLNSSFSIQNAAVTAYNADWTCTATTSTTVDFTITGSPASESGGANAVAVFYPTTLINASCYDLLCERFEIRYMTHYGFDPHEISTRNKFIDCRSHSNGLDGFVCDFQVDSVYKGNHAYNNGRHGFNCTTSSNRVQYDDNHGYNNGLLENGLGGNGLVIQRGSDNLPFPKYITVTGGQYYGNRMNNIKLSMATDITITGVGIYESYKSGIVLNGATGCNLTGNTFRNNGSLTNNTYYDIDINDATAGFAIGTQISSYNNVESNTMRADGTNKVKYGINEAGSSDYDNLCNNTIFGQVNALPILITGANTTLAAPDGRVRCIAVSGTTKTLALGDQNTAQVCSNGSAQVITIPPNASVAFNIGVSIAFVQEGAGQVSFTPGAAVTINSPSAKLKLTGQFSQGIITQTAANVWDLAGDLTT